MLFVVVVDVLFLIVQIWLVCPFLGTATVSTGAAAIEEQGKLSFFLIKIQFIEEIQNK